MKKEIIRLMLTSLGIVLTLIVGHRLYLEYQADIQLFLDPGASKAELLAHIRSHGTFVSVFLIILTAVICATPGIPTLAVGATAGLSFGLLTGVIINILGDALGNIAAIFLMHRLEFLNEKTKTSRWVQTIRQMKHPKTGVMLGYMIPIIPFSMVNSATDAMKSPLQQIMSSIVIGVIPPFVLYACGEEVPFRGYDKTAVTLVAGTTALVGLVVFIYKDRKEKRGKQKHK